MAPYADYFIFIEVTRNPTTGKVTLGAVFGSRFLAPTNTIFILPQGSVRSQLAKSVLRDEIYRWSIGGWTKGIAGFQLMPSSILKGFRMAFASRPTVRMAWFQYRSRWWMRKLIEPFLQELKERTFARSTMLSPLGGSFQWNRWRIAFLHWKDGVVSLSIFDFKQTILGAGGKAGLTILFHNGRTQGKYFPSAWARRWISVLSTIIENRRTSWVSHYITRRSSKRYQ